MGDAGSLLEGRRPGQRGSAERERRNHLGVATELAFRHRPNGWSVGGENRRGMARKDHPCAGGADHFQKTATMLFVRLGSHSSRTIAHERATSQIPLGMFKHGKQARRSAPWEKVVGAVRFELTTSCTRNKRATRLRYAPTLSTACCRLWLQLATSKLQKVQRWGDGVLGQAC